MWYGMVWYGTCLRMGAVGGRRRVVGTDTQNLMSRAAVFSQFR